MHLVLAETVVAFLALMVGGLIQGSIGFGLALIATPVLSLLAPESIPATILMVSLPMTAWMAFRERDAIDKRGFIELSLARLPGTAAAALVIGVLSQDRVIVLIGAVIVLAAVISALAPDFELRTRLRVVAGVLSGFTGTIAGVGGPPLALAYQRRPGPQLRSTLAMTFVVGSVVSLGALALADEVHVSHLILAIQLLPGLVLGLFLSARLGRFLDQRWLRPSVLAFAIVSGLAAMWKGLA